MSERELEDRLTTALGALELVIEVIRDEERMLAVSDLERMEARAQDAERERDLLGNELARERSQPGGSFDQWARLQRAEMTLRELLVEVDCRIEHGADSNGHLEYVRTKLCGTVRLAEV